MLARGTGPMKRGHGRGVHATQRGRHASLAHSHVREARTRVVSACSFGFWHMRQKLCAKNHMGIKGYSSSNSGARGSNTESKNVTRAKRALPSLTGGVSVCGEKEDGEGPANAWAAEAGIGIKYTLKQSKKEMKKENK